ncbi:unnamed protein product [Prorocentrum cordatum]|uniref:Uncharacterized protein n=1 Tax=Prorocentrum cordatum TaxID=2364126 RepID=A0ABN9V886_9DINO|nr:unnamed protein product [Polarella glacialis]
MVKATVETSVSYGTSITGTNGQELQRLRQLVGSQGPTSSASLTLRLLLTPGSRVDPIFKASADPLCAMLAAWKQQWVPQHIITQGIRRAQQRARSSKGNPWQSVAGPFTAYLATLDRLRIQADGFSSWTFPWGLTIQPATLCVHGLRKLIDLACEAWQWRQISTTLGCPELKSGILLEPVLSLLGRSSPLSPEEKAYLRSVVIGAQWTQQRMFEAKYVQSPLCRICHDFPGTLYHRHLLCDGLVSASLQPAGPLCRVLPQEPTELVLLLGSRVLLPFDRFPQRPEPAPEQFYLGERSSLTGDLFVDGSMYDHDVPNAAVAGWAVIAMHPDPPPPRALDDFRVSVVFGGGVEGPIQCIDRAELVAVLHTLRAAMPPELKEIAAKQQFLAAGAEQQKAKMAADIFNGNERDLRARQAIAMREHRKEQLIVARDHAQRATNKQRETDDYRQMQADVNDRVRRAKSADAALKEDIVKATVAARQIQSAHTRKLQSEIGHGASKYTRRLTP